MVFSLLLRQATYIFCHRGKCGLRYKSVSKNWTKVMMEYDSSLPSRADPVIMKLNTPEFNSIFSPELHLLSNLFKKYNYELRIAGGAVRDILMGIKPKDLDFATNATPDQMKEMFINENIRMINTRGEKHGTITTRINDKENFEVTTLRIDVLTNGRHAVVEFTKDWKIDANRRDLTINSMYLDLDGKVYDYFYGYDDLQKRKVVFVGHTARRIQEDFLRILRYFRFYGKIVDDPNTHNEATITAIKENISGLESISGERIWSEWNKILEGRHSGELTMKMLECGAAKYIGLPEKPDVDNFKTIYYRAVQNKLKLKPITLVTSMLKDEEDLMCLYLRLKVSANEKDLALFLILNRDFVPSDKLLRHCKLQILYRSGKTSDTRSFINELLMSKGEIELYNEFSKWEPPKFPVNGNMLKEHVRHKKMMGFVLTKLKEMWLDRNFEINAEDLLKHVPTIVNNFEEQKK